MTSVGAYSALADLTAPFTPPSPAAWADMELLEAQRTLAQIRRRTDAAAAVLAAEIKHRSRPELGYTGLAARLGARTAENLIQRTAGISKHEAHALTRVGSLLTEDSAPWLASVGDAVASGESSVAAADVIRAGLGSPDNSITEAALAQAANQLLTEAPALTVERLAARARELRCELDLDRVAEREEWMRDRRYLHIAPQADGMTRISGLLDPESAATIVSAFDAATSPRRGGPRFVSDEGEARAQRIIDDPRTTEQLTLDTFVELVKIATLADDGTVLGSTQPTVHILVTKRELDSDRGAGYLEGQKDPVSLHTVRRHACSAGAIPILFDGRQPLDVGRTHRYYSPRQKSAIAARDGGCIFPGCDRPPSWTETHHINEWQFGGKTDIRDGVLLCRHHHLLTHNNKWRVIRHEDSYFLVPPRTIDPEQRPVPAQNRGTAARKLVS